MPSSVIHDFEYDAETGRLTVWFTTGRVYRYADVPEDVYVSLCGARSKGAFFNRHIRDRYLFQEATPPAD